MVRQDDCDTRPTTRRAALGPPQRRVISAPHQPARAHSGGRPVRYRVRLWDKFHMALNPFSRLVRLLAEPGTVARDIQQRPALWFPLVVHMLVIAGFWIGYFQFLDFNWYRDHGGLIPTESMSADEREFIDTYFNAKLMCALFAGGEIAWSLGTLVFGAAYLSLWARLRNETHTAYSVWLGVLAWLSLPSLVVYLSMATVFFMAANGQIAPEALDVLNPAAWLNLPTDHDWFGLLSSLKLFSLLSLALICAGTAALLEKPITAAGIRITGPLILVYSAWVGLVAVL